MSRRKAIFTQSDIVRAGRAAKQIGAGGVQILPDGSIVIHLSSNSLPETIDIRIPSTQTVLDI